MWRRAGITLLIFGKNFIIFGYLGWFFLLGFGHQPPWADVWMLGVFILLFLGFSLTFLGLVLLFGIKHEKSKM